MKKIFPILLILVVSANSFAQAPNCLWANSAGGAGEDDGQSVATDANGNVYVTGYFKSATITFGTITLTNADNTGNTTDIFIAKYTPNGNILWATSAGGTSYDSGISICTDANGNVYVTGDFQSTTISFGTITLTNANNSGLDNDVFIVKYAPNGTVLWGNSAGTAGYDRGSCVSTDTSGNVFITGYFSSPTITFDTTILTNAGGGDIFIAKYDAAGNVLWAKSAGGTNSDYGQSVSTDASGNVYVTGYFGSPTITFGTTTLTNAGITGNSKDIFVAKYDASGTVLWATSVGGTSYDSGNSICTDANGNVYLTGYFNSATITFDTTTLTNASAGSEDIFIAKYDATGNVLWAKSAGTPGYDRGNSVSTDTSGNVYVTGNFGSLTITFGTTTLTNAGFTNIFLTKYDAAGNVIWAKSAGGTFYDLGNSICTDVNGNVYLTGYFQSATITLGTTSLTNASSGGTSDVFTAKYTGILTRVDEVFGNNELNISPNPTNSIITLAIPKLINANITITNLTGMQVASFNLQNTNTKTIDISQLAEGVYFVKLKSEEGFVIKKLVKTN